MINAPLTIALTTVSLAALALWLESRFAWAAQVGSTLLAILGGALLSNFELVPLSSSVYDGIFGPVTSLAIAWLLLAVDLRDLRLAGPRMLGAFTVALLGTMFGAAVAVAVFGAALPGEAAKLAGVMVGTYSGGSLNFVAVGQAVDLPRTLFAAAAASDNALTALWMGATLLLPLWLAPWYPKEGYPKGGYPKGEHQQTEETGVAADLGSAALGGEAVAHRPSIASPLAPVAVSILDLALLIAFGLGLVWASEVVGEWWPGVPSVVWLTTFALAAGQIPRVRRLAGALQLGLYALTLFFVVIGIGCRFSEILRVGLAVFYFTATVVAVHGVVVYGLGRLLRLDLGSLSVASQAAVGGPSTALALAVARGWPRLALPGMIVGLLGYALGTYLGLAVAALLGPGG